MDILLKQPNIFTYLRKVNRGEATLETTESANGLVKQEGETDDK